MSLEQFWQDIQPEIKDILGVNKYEIWIQKGDDVKKYYLRCEVYRSGDR